MVHTSPHLTAIPPQSEEAPTPRRKTASNSHQKRRENASITMTQCKSTAFPSPCTTDVSVYCILYTKRTIQNKYFVQLTALVGDFVLALEHNALKFHLAPLRFNHAVVAFTYKHIAGYIAFIGQSIANIGLRFLLGLF